MNRILKFRTWCKISEHFSDMPFLSSSGGQVLWHHTGDEISITNLDEGNHVVQQFTGLKDKNGREIFEGDIVSTFYPELPIGTVIFDGATCAYRVRAGDILLPIVTARFIEGKFSELLPVAERILGNIFENPELLKV